MVEYQTSHLSELNLQRQSPSFIIVPRTDEPTFYEAYVGFDPQRAVKQLNTNMDVIQCAKHNFIKTEDMAQFIKIQTFLKTTWERYKDKFEEISEAPDAILSMFSYLGERGVHYFPEDPSSIGGHLPIKKVGAYLSHYLSQVVGPTLVLSETHATTPSLVEIIKAEKPEAKIGVIVFDTHVDTQKGPAKNIPRKTNSVRLLVSNRKNGRYAEQILVIGQPDELYAWQRGQSSDPEQYHDRIRVITEEDLYGQDPHQLSFSKKEMEQIIERELKFFAEQGISNILISFDIDKLQSGVFDLTAMEYNPLHALLFLSSLDLWYLDTENLFDALTKDDGGMSSTVLTEPTLLGGRGFSISYIQNTLKQIQHACRKQGIQYGVKHKGAHVVGDIVEFAGPDYKNLTKRAVLEVAKSMYPEIALK